MSQYRWEVFGTENEERVGKYSLILRDDIRRGVAFIHPNWEHSRVARINEGVAFGNFALNDFVDYPLTATDLDSAKSEVLAYILLVKEG